VLLRMVRIEDKETCQGIMLDWRRLQILLVEAVTDLFPDAQLLPVHAEADAPLEQERTMTVLPFQLDPGPLPAPAEPGWTPLRVGLSLAWFVAGIALLAVALGGWSLLDLSERRIRFVSAVTHELRTPLTTLRLYLDMLLGGLVRDEKQREEYLQTLNAEAERLNRLVSNVLDFSRLEKQRPHMTRTQVVLADLLAQVQATWQGRCQDAGKDLRVENSLDPQTLLCTDAALLQQVLGNLLDNACKYSRGAEDARLWLRVRGDNKSVVFEVEDRGPGVAVAERQSIFRAFRRGRQADVTAGGVGLGLALAHRWTHLLGGRLVLRAPGSEPGACFQVSFPL
jgi:signal transduction histidine kinase